MTKEQVEQWIVEYLRKNPQVARRYKEQRMARLDAELGYAERIKAGESIFGGGNPVLTAQTIQNINKTIEETKDKDDKELLVDSFIKRYENAKSIENRILKTSINDDHYLEKAFQEHNVEGICQELIDEEISQRKYFCRDLAERSVVNAFAKIGVQLEPKQAEQIDRIIEMHDPVVVKSAMKSLMENPTKNMLALAKNISEAPGQDRKKLKNLKALDYAQIAAGATLCALGLGFAAMGGLSFLSILQGVMGVLNLGSGISGIVKHTRKMKNLNEKESLMSGCIQDLLNEVELQETFNKGLETI